MKGLKELNINEPINSFVKVPNAGLNIIINFVDHHRK